MEKADKSPRVTRGIVVFAIAVALAVVVGVVLAVRRSGSSGSVQSPAAVSTTVPYNAHPGPGGTTVMTEPVDGLTMAVPSSWHSPAADPLTLPPEMDKLAAQAPSLAALLQAEGQLAAKSAIRLFAYQAGPPNAFVSVVSFSSPGVTAPSPGGIDAIVAEAKKRSPNVAVSGVKLPIGQALKLDSSLVVQKQPVIVEVLVVTVGGRTMEIEMVSETTAAEIPPLFAQIAQSLRLG